MSSIEEVKQKTDIVEIVSEYTTLTKAGHTLKGLCPFHSEKHGSFFVYPDQQSWHCFGACNTGGDVFSFLMKKLNIDFGEALQILADKAGVLLPRTGESKETRDAKKRLYQLNSDASLYFHNLLNSEGSEKARDYLSKRGVNQKSIDDFQLGYAPEGWQTLEVELKKKGYTEEELQNTGLIIKSEDGRVHDRFRKLLMFPIPNAKGQIVGFGGRVLDKSLPKYMNSPQTPLFDKSANLYGINLAAQAIREAGSAIIVEGYMDAISAHQAGFKNVIASMGTALTENQIIAIKKLTKNVIFALDSDTAGKEATLRGLEYENMLEAEVKVVIMPEGKDPDNIIKESPEEFKKLIENAIPIMDFVFTQAEEGLNLQDAEGKSKFSEKLLPSIAKMKDVVRQAHYIQKLALMVRVNEKRMEALLNEHLTQGKRLSAQAKPPQAVGTKPKLSSNPIEDYCLSLLLQHPELREEINELKAEYFENTLNREIYQLLLSTSSADELKEKLGGIATEHFDKLANTSIQSNQIEQKIMECSIRLKEKYYKNIELKREAILASERSEKGSKAELERLTEQGIITSDHLREVFHQKEKWDRIKRRSHENE